MLNVVITAFFSTSHSLTVLSLLPDNKYLPSSEKVTDLTSSECPVNVLTTAQQHLSARFASRGIDKFDGLEWREGMHGIPLLPEYTACFECVTEHRYEGGDHKIIVGRVLRAEDRETDPLIIYRGQFLSDRGSGPGE